ncbi:hypothetical protein [Xanthobacter autotrophicus]|uniref:hypothetical protein n=1 Tax=Xanthobacter autotrophicus TaxID=280 RepID=UPI00372BD82A
MSDAPPFDAADRDRACEWLKDRSLLLFDPLGAGAHPDDVHFAPSLSAARRIMEPRFGLRRADGTPFRVLPLFVERAAPNAFAIDLGGLHLCALHVGLATTVFELACFVFAQCETFPEVGDPSCETSPALPAGADLCYWILDELAVRSAGDGPIGLDIIPNDPERRLMAHFLAQLMLRFTWLHELFHCLNGHAGFLRSLNMDAPLHELPGEEPMGLIEPAPDLPIDGLTFTEMRQAFEYDADRSALKAMLAAQMTGDEPFAVLAERPLALRLKLTVCAGLLMTFLFDQAARRSGGGGRETHPLAMNRRHGLARLLPSHSDQVRSAFVECEAESRRLSFAIPKLGQPATVEIERSIGDESGTATVPVDDIKYKMVKPVKRFAFEGGQKISGAVG